MRLRTLFHRPLGSSLIAAALFLPSPDSPEAVSFNALLREAREFLAIGNESRAAAAFRRAFLLSPADSAPLIGLASIAEAAGDRDEAVLYLSAARTRAPNDAVISEQLSRLDASPATGEATSVVVAYLGFAAGAGPGPIGSVRDGESVRLEALLFQGLDENGSPVAIEPFFDVSTGLSLEDRPRLSITARDPSVREWIAVGDAASGSTGRCDIRIVGPPATIAIRESRRSAADAGSITAPPGETLLLSASIADAAGNRLFVPRLDWSAAAADNAARSFGSALAERHSLRPLAHFFEPHRNRLTVPAPEGPDAAPPTITVTASDPASRTSGGIVIVVDPALPPSLATKSPMPFFDGSYEEALRAARESGRPVFAVVAAHW